LKLNPAAAAALCANTLATITMQGSQGLLLLCGSTSGQEAVQLHSGFP